MMMIVKINGIGVLYVLMSLMYLLAPYASLASDPPTIAVETDEHRIRLVLTALSEAISNPTDFNIDIISVALPTDQKEALSGRIRNFIQKSYQDSGSSLRFKIAGSVRDDGTPVNVRFGIGNLAVSMIVNVEFLGTDYKVPRYNPIITNLSEILDQLELFVETNTLKMKPYINKAEPVVVKSSGERSIISNNLLTPKTIYDDYTRFTDVLSNNEFGHDIANGNFGVASLYYHDPWSWLCRKIVVITDQNLNQIIASSENPCGDDGDWFSAMGWYGEGEFGFKQPNGIAYAAMMFYVADGKNNVVKGYTFDWDNGSPSHALTLDDGFSYVADVAAGHIPDFSNPANDDIEIAVLDQGNNRVYIYDRMDGNDWSFPSYCTKGTSIAYARNYVNHFPMNYVYILDDGGKKVNLMRSNGSGTPTSTPMGIFPYNSRLSSITVDVYGMVYVTDNVNSTIYVLDPSLSGLIATFGETGTADNQLFYPNRFKMGDGYDYAEPRNIPLAIGDAFTTEILSNSTGTRRQALGSDMLSYEMSYHPQYMSGYGDRVRIEWTMSNTVESWRIIKVGGSVLDSKHDDVNVGWSNHYQEYWLEESDPDSCWYIFEIRLRSVFGTTDETFIDSIYVERYVNPGPHIIVEETGTIDMTGEISDYCGVHGRDTAKIWKVFVNSYDNWNDSNLTYYWSRSGCLTIAEDTTFDSTWSYFINTQPEMYFKVRCNPDGIPSNGQYRELFWIMVTDETYDPDKNWPEYNWLDTIEVHEWYYYLSCQMSCTPDCPPINHGCPMLSVMVDGEYQLINNILPQAEKSHTDSTDLFLIDIPDEGNISFKISEDENEVTHFDQIEVQIIDIPRSIDPIFTNKEQLCASKGFLIAPTFAVTDDGEDITYLLAEEDHWSYTANGPGYIDLEYDVGVTSIALMGPTPPEKTFQKLVPGNFPNIITLSAQTSNGYNFVQHIYSRMTDRKVDLIEMDDYVSIDGILRLRMEWTQGINIDHLPYTQYESIDFPNIESKMVSAFCTDQGNISTLIDGIDGNYAILKPGETIELLYEAEPASPFTNRFAVFKAVGRYSSLTSDSDVILPDEFEFAQNYPNPFNPTTTFSFSLPQAEHTKLEIYNIVGQKVTTLVDGIFEAGEHKIEWNGRGDSNTRIASGVYFATFSAGEFKSTRKVMVLK